MYKTPVCTLLVYYDAIIYYMYEGIESEERSDLLNKRERERQGREIERARGRKDKR